ncbi:peptidyl-prolyl cis- cyclophilin type [Chlorella sorokiniana]|uniref:Peptidyl-prolyl cis-cyclophilin type n=1 Tax=Chlorella sorokiniana TaxID=3076 RepID=A0A2P6U4M1_CHLSO|nr:peptidyl-prolyl cis- cyclophilin type [Chlorella sorokiniana]|eukprot:PRW61257.1 peptidyl-prolyl cis- cyclophilin type [Chlorella sorokiniana]
MLGALLLLLLLALQAVAADPAARHSLHAAARGLAAAAITPTLTEPGRAVVLHTQFGQIRIRLLEQLAPQITALVWDLAAKRGCKGTACAFYRSEARPPPPANPLGPPYALLQGRLHDLAEDPPYEGNTIEVRRGHVCFIPGGKDFFIALGDHPEWGTSHPVWGMVDEWATVDAIVSQRHNTWVDPGCKRDCIPLRILQVEVPIKIAAEGDHAYGSSRWPP